MEYKFAERMYTVHRSFIREILKVTANPEIISFAGGLPNPELFPIKSIQAASNAIFDQIGSTALQYSTTEGDPNLRKWIAERYMKRFGMEVSPDDIIITTGSQQCLDLCGKVFLNKGDKVVIEEPGYLGAIQSFSIFEPEFITVTLDEDGPNLEQLEEAFKAGAKVFYAVPNFQNPSGISYSLEKRKAVAELMDKYDIIYVEDDPYGELRFKGEHLPPVYSFRKKAGLLLGSFSKVAAPGFRLGWAVAPQELRDKMIIAKQACDLHTSTINQATIARWLADNDIDSHIALIKERYGAQAEAMVEAMTRHFPKEVRWTDPEGGMFLWVTMPEGCSSMKLFDKAIAKKVAFVPGTPFHIGGRGDNTMRLNFSNAGKEKIEEGIARLGESLGEFITQS